MSEPCDEMPLPSEPVLSEEESSRQLRDDFCRGYKQRAELAEAEVARLTRELSQERQGRPAEQPLIDVPLDRQVVLLNRQLAQALNEVNALQLTLEETQECAGAQVAALRAELEATKKRDLEYLKEIRQPTEVIIDLVQKNPKFFDSRAGNKCLPVAANKLTQLVQEWKRNRQRETGDR